MTQWLHVSGNVEIQMPNEIFDDLSDLVATEESECLNGDKFITWKHKAFSYAYYYLITYIYRNVLYGIGQPEDYSQEIIINTLIAKRSKVSYITKKNGILEKQLKYVKTTNNYPVSFYVDNKILEFKYINDIKDDFKSVLDFPSPNFQIREPILAFNRLDEDFTGTFYDFQSTHRIPIKTFIDVVSDKQLGYVGLYVYGFLSMMNDRYRNGYQISNKQLAKVVGCNERTVAKYTKLLESKGFIYSRRKLYEYRLLEKIYNVI